MDIGNELEAIQNLYTDSDFRVSWQLDGFDEENASSIFDIAFNKVGSRNLKFEAYEEGEDVDELLFSKDLSIFVYARSIPTFSYISPDDRIRVRAEESGVLLYPLFSQTIDQIEAVSYTHLTLPTRS